MHEALFKVSDNDFEVIYEFAEVDSSVHCANSKLSLAEVEQRLLIRKAETDRLDSEIEKLVCYADGMDYAVAAGCGVLAGLIDIFWVGEFSLNSGKAWSNHQVNDFVMKIAQKKGYSGDRLDGAIKFLEDKYKIPSDNVWSRIKSGISTRTHHLDDLAHHPSPVGLFVSILTQFTKTAYFSNSEGTWLPISVENGELIGNDFPGKILCGSVNWFYHLVSDMSGSNKAAGVGMGIPGPIMSMLKEFSALPGINKTGFSESLKNAFNKHRFDLRSELAVVHELKRQAIPVLINEVMVRTFYMIRRFIVEYKRIRDLSALDWKTILPFKNHTIVRMLLVAHGTFTAIDLGDAAIRAFDKGGELTVLLANFALRVNFVGVGRLTLACWSELKIQHQDSKLRHQRLNAYSEVMLLTNAKFFFKQGENWVAAADAEEAIQELTKVSEDAIRYYSESYSEMKDNLRKISNFSSGIDKCNPGLKQEIIDFLEN